MKRDIRFLLRLVRNGRASANARGSKLGVVKISFETAAWKTRARYSNFRGTNLKGSNVEL